MIDSKAATDAARPPSIAVVLPCYRVTAHILDVLASIPDAVEHIIVVDDACPDGSGELVRKACTDPRVRVHVNPTNLGVGGAVLHGYRQAIDAGADVIVKIDGDGQMDPRLIGHFVGPILAGDADYTKGNRFFDLTNIARMPRLRIFGNAVLSFMAKLSTGYWDLFDPTNGYTAIHADVARRLPFDRISQRYFFETDLLFRLNTLRAVAVDVPMDAHYGDEVSNLKVSRVLGEFLAKHTRNFGKRIFYNYFLRDLSLASPRTGRRDRARPGRQHVRCDHVVELDAVERGHARRHGDAGGAAGVHGPAVPAGLPRLRHRLGPAAPAAPRQPPPGPGLPGPVATLRPGGHRPAATGRACPAPGRGRASAPAAETPARTARRSG
ncbi:glycosyltransferase family 2 protein [Luteimonas granuli]|uniref:glycosyltransferase family 2 protein n=1 Tax=Luteimonas granuli TaxID=1176533 RepID=UPI00319DD26D